MTTTITATATELRPVNIENRRTHFYAFDAMLAFPEEGTPALCGRAFNPGNRPLVAYGQEATARIAEQELRLHATHVTSGCVQCARAYAEQHPEEMSAERDRRAARGW